MLCEAESEYKKLCETIEKEHLDYYGPRNHDQKSLVITTRTRSKESRTEVSQEETIQSDEYPPLRREIYPRGPNEDTERNQFNYDAQWEISDGDFQSRTNESNEEKGPPGYHKKYYALRPRKRVTHYEEPKTQPNWKMSEPDSSPPHDYINTILNKKFPRSGCGRVEVRRSLLAGAGWGLFAIKRFKENDSLATYEGNVITDLTSKDYLSSNRDYVNWAVKNAKTKERIYIDAIHESSCFGRYANDPIDDHLVNAKILWNGKRMILKATMDIDPGDEIYLSYSDDYWGIRLNYLPEKLRQRVESRFTTIEDGGEGPRVLFDETVEVAIVENDEAPQDLCPEEIPEPLQRIPTNLLTRIRRFNREVDRQDKLDSLKEERIKEEFLFENVFECEELGGEVATLLNGKKFRDGPYDRLYEIYGVRYDEEFETIIGWRKPLSGRTHPEDASAFRVFGKDGLYELSELYLIEHPDEEDNVRWPNDNNEWANEQMADPLLISIINQIRMLGGDETIRPNNAGTKIKYRLGKTDDGKERLLLRIAMDKKTKKEITQTMVPYHLIPKLLRLFHEGHSHLGINRMVETIKVRYYWKGIDQDVKEHIDKCMNCKLRKTYQRRPQVPIMKYNAVNRPLDRVHMDLIGPLPSTQNGNRYIMVIKDYLTKYVWLIPLKGKTATEVAEAYVTRFICQAGIPDMVVSDRGNEFVNSLMKNVSDIMGINRISTTPYNPRSDGFVENHNKTLKDQLFNYIDTLKQNDWDLYLPTVQLLYNTTVSLATGYSPMLLMTGKESKMPSFNHMEKIVGSLQPEMLNNEYVRGLVNSMRDYHECTLDQTEKNKLRFNVRVKQPLEFIEYEVGQKFMLVRRPISEFKSIDDEQAYKISMKLVERYEGPYVITKKICPVLYEANVEGVLKRVHAIHMKPF
jgi:hypothetical protein